MSESASPKLKVVIVGAGLIGVCSAYALARRGVQVEVLDAAEGPGLATSFANGAALTPSMAEPWNGPGVWKHLLASIFAPSSAMALRLSAAPALAGWGTRFLLNSRADAFARAAADNYLLSAFSTEAARRWREALGLDFDSVDADSLKVFRDEAALAAAAALAESLRPLGLKSHALGPEETARLEPALQPVRDRIAGALRFEGDMRGDAYRFTCAMAGKAEALGARFRYGVRVEGLTGTASRVAGARIAGETIGADAVLVCAAHASAGLVRPYGLRLAVKPVKGYSLTYDMSGLNDVPRHAVIDDGLHAIATPLGNRLRLAGTAEFAGESRNLDERRLDNLRRFLRELYPQIAERVQVEGAGQGWTGLRPMSADGRPFIGPTEIDGLWLNTGHGHLGWTMAAGSAELLEALMLGDAPPLDPRPYAADRA